MGTLTKSEREIVLVIADDETTWHVHTDSKRAASTRLRKIAGVWGVAPKREGVGYGFDLPLKAVRFVGPPSAARIARARASGAFRKAKSSPVDVAQSESSASPALKAEE